MELPAIVLVLIGVAIAVSVLVAVVMSRRREHALRDRLAEEYERVLLEHNRRDRHR